MATRRQPRGPILYYVCRDIPDRYMGIVLQENHPVIEHEGNWHDLSMQWNPIMITQTQLNEEIHEHYFDDWVYHHVHTNRPFVFHYIEAYEYDILDAFGIPQLGEFNVDYTYSPFWDMKRNA